MAFLPPTEIQERVTQIKRYIAERYGSRAALKSPPHITLQPPFLWGLEQLDELEQSLREFARDRAPMAISLNGFGAFAPRVVYVCVPKTLELLEFQQALQAYCAQKLNISQNGQNRRPFAPHMTVAYRDLKPKVFKTLWPEFESQPFKAVFTVKTLTLLQHNGRQWDRLAEYKLGSREAPSQ